MRLTTIGAILQDHTTTRIIHAGWEIAVSSYVAFMPWWTTPTGIDGSGTLDIQT